MTFESDNENEPGNIEPGLEDAGAATENEEASADLATDEAAAKARGWVPKEEFRGKAEDWQDAKSFLDRNASLATEVRELRERLTKADDEYAERLRRIEAANERIIREDRERLIRQIEAAKRQAVELGDTEEYDRIRREEDDYYQRIAENDRQAEPASRQQEQRPRLMPETESWLQRNSWFHESQAMQQIALGFYSEALEGMPAHKDETKRLAYVERKMREVYPDKFGGAQRSNSVESGSRNTAQTATITKLTADERNAMRRFIAKGIIKDEAEYIRYLNEYNG